MESDEHNSAAPAQGSCQQVLQDCLVLLQAKRAFLALFDTVSGDLVVVATVGMHPSKAHISLKQGITGWIATHGKPVLIADIARDARYQPCDGPPQGAMLGTPLVEGHVMLGALMVASDQVGSFTKTALATLDVLARYATVVACQMRQAQQEAAPARQLGVLLAAAQAVTSLLGPHEVFANITAGIHQLVSYEHAMIFAYDAIDDELQVVAGNSTRGNALRQARVSMQDSASLSVRVAQTRRACIYAPDMQNLATGHITEAFLEGDDLALLCVPLLSKEVLRGIVTLARCEPFLADDLRVITNLAPLIATALENVELYSAVKIEKDRLAAIFSATTDGICVVNEALRIIEANAALARLTGRELGVLQGSRATAIFTNTNVLAAITTAVQMGRALPLVEYEMPARPGVGARQMLISAAPIPTPEGHHAVVVVRDITELRELDRMKTQFLQMVSHDIRSPLHALNGYLDIALSRIGGTLNPEKQDIVQRARQCSKHLTARVRDLLVLAHADAGFATLQIAPVDLYHIIQEAISEIKLLADEQGITIHPPSVINLPPFAGDGERLEQVARNLLSNAVKFSPSGGHIGISLTVRKNVIELSVADTGCGIAHEHLPHLFDRFYQVPTEQGRQRGTGQGLGLAIVKTIVEQHSGWVQVVSTPGQGSAFTVHLPLPASVDHRDPA